ncbi:MAG: PEP-CTERM sorting domain-containing protein [Limisphaerales bacterium]
MKIYIILIMIIFASFSQSIFAQGNLVLNGEFNIISNGVPDGWILNGNSYYDSKYGNPTPCLQLYGVATANQTMNGLISGITYIVSGDYQAGQIAGYNFNIDIDGFIMFEAIASTNLDWQSFNFFYTATSSSAVLEISLSETSDNLFHVDNIAMYAVPEPSAASLIFLGGGIFFYVRRNKKHSKLMSPD